MTFSVLNHRVNVLIISVVFLCWSVHRWLTVLLRDSRCCWTTLPLFSASAIECVCLCVCVTGVNERNRKSEWVDAVVFTYTAERTRLLSDRLLSLNLWYSLINIHYHVLEKTSCFLLSSCFDSLFQSTLTLLVLMNSISWTFPPRENQATVFYSKCVIHK